MMTISFLKKLPKRSIEVALILLPLQAFAAKNWTYHQEKDNANNLSYSFARSPIPRTDLYDDLKLEVTCKDSKLQVVIDSEVLIASQGSAFDVEYQIDKQAPVQLQMRMFPDSKRKGYTETQAKQIADAILGGQSIFVRVTTMIRRVLSGAMPLDDAAGPIKQVYADCGLTAENASTAQYSLANFNEDFNKLSVAQQQAVLSKLKQFMMDLH